MKWSTLARLSLLAATACTAAPRENTEAQSGAATDAPRQETSESTSPTKPNQKPADFYVDGRIEDATCATYSVEKRDCSDGGALAFKTIKDGINHLSAGKRVEIRGGTYDEMLDPYHGVVWPSGTSWDDAPVVAGFAAEQAVIQPVADHGIAMGLSGYYDVGMGPHAAAYVIISDLILDGSSIVGMEPPGDNYAFARGGDGFGCLSVEGNVHHIRVQRMEIRNFGGMGFSQGCPDMEILDNDIHHNGDTGADHGLYNPNKRMILAGNHIHHNGGYGVHWYGGSSTDSVIRNNRIHDNGNCDANGRPEHGRGCLDSGAIVVSPGSDPNGTTSNVRIFNNVIHDEQYGIDLKSTSDARIYSNTIYNASRLRDGRSAFVLGDGQAGTLIANNILARTDGSVTVENGTAPTAHANLCDGVTGDATLCASIGGLAQQAAGLVDPFGGDFRPCAGAGNPAPSCSAASPAIAAGDDLGVAGAVDFLGHPRPAGAWTIGAYEP